MPYDVVAYEADEQARLLDPWEEGVFHRMMRLAWMNGSIPADLNQLAELCRIRPSSLKKSWPNLSPLWYEEAGRLRNKKQESERVFLELKRDSAKASAKLSWKSKKRKQNRKANAMPSQSERIASLPSPSQPIPTQEKNTEEGNGDLPVAEKRTGPPDAAYEHFARRHKEFTGAAYVHKQADFIQLATLRKANGVPARGQPDQWEAAVENYFGSPLTPWTLADLCVKFPTYRNSPTNGYGKPINHRGNNNGKQSQADRVSQHVADQARRFSQSLSSQDPDRSGSDDER